jgi:hypothetical protein
LVFYFYFFKIKRVEQIFALFFFLKKAFKSRSAPAEEVVICIGIKIKLTTFSTGALIASLIGTKIHFVVFLWKKFPVSTEILSFI